MASCTLVDCHTSAPLSLPTLWDLLSEVFDWVRARVDVQAAFGRP